MDGWKITYLPFGARPNFRRVYLSFSMVQTHGDPNLMGVNFFQNFFAANAPVVDFVKPQKPGKT